MNKIGIITITADVNFGNRLQNYAVQRNVEENGYIAETIYNNENAFDPRVFKYRVKNKIKHIFHFRIGRHDEVRYAFAKWDKKYMKFTRKTYTQYSAQKGLANKYKKFLCGSDQVWNPYFNRTSLLDFAAFAPVEKRIAISASFGVDSIPIDQSESYKKWLKEMHMISVREQRGVDLVRELAGREATLLCDPAMTLNDSDWREIEEQPDWYHGEPFVFGYFLGDLLIETKEDIEQHIKNSGADYYFTGGESNISAINPSEFLWMIDHAELILTDSFHATVFSIIFGKRFVLYDRISSSDLKNDKSMSSRIMTLFNLFSMNTRYEERTRSYGEVSYDKHNTHEVLKREQNKFKQFLKEALNS